MSSLAAAQLSPSPWLALAILAAIVGCALRLQLARRARCVIVADDFGICMERSRGIVQAIKGGVVTCTSVMANGAAATEAIQLARDHGLLHVVGLHLNLTEGGWQR